MANGFAPFLLEHLKQLTTDNYPGTKIAPSGFLKMLLLNNPSIGIPDYEKIRLVNSAGHLKDIKLWYHNRITPSQIATEKSCDNDFVPVRKEMTLASPFTRKVAFYMSNETVSKYMEDASKTVSAGQPATPFMQEQMTVLMTVANGIVGAIDIDLLSGVVWGNNVVSGNNAATTVNINKNAVTNDLVTGLPKILQDALENEFAGELLFAGSGLFSNYELAKVAASPAMNGIDTSRFTGYNWFFDNYAKTQWGTNQIGVFSKGSIGFVDVNKYLGFRAKKLANSTYFTMALPTSSVQSDGTTEMMLFDVQIKEIDCPTEVPNGYYGDIITVSEGYQVIISKIFGLFQIPSDAYDASDVLTGNNGALRYTITNECVDCEPEIG